MKHLIILSALLCSAFGGWSQTVADCNNAQNVCSNPDFLFQGTQGAGLASGLTISNPGTNPQTGNGASPTAPPNTGCLLTNGVGPQWLILTVSSSGNLGFSFGAAGSSNPQIGFYDWAMWPYTPTSCASIFSNSLAPVACNWNAQASGGTGMGAPPTGGNSGNFQPTIPVTAGQQFLILISNYSSVTTPVSFSNTGTAGLSCGFNSEICAGNSVTVSPVGFVPLGNPSFTLMPSGATNSTGTFVVAPLTTLTYTIYGSGTNSQNMPALQTSTTIVTVDPQPLSVPTLTQTSCTSTLNAINLNLSFNPSNPIPTYTVNWTAPAPNGITSYSQTVITGSIVPGTYTAQITAQGGCSTTTVVTINPIPAASVFSLNPGGSTYTVTCAQPTVVLSGTSPSYNYTWTNGIIAQLTGDTTNYISTSIGTWSVIGQNPASGCVSVHIFTVSLNTTVPTSNVNPVNQSINCGAGVTAVTCTGTAISPTTNVTHMWYAPGSPNPVVSGGPISLFAPTIVGTNGTNTFVLVNNVNGCSVTKYVYVTSSFAYPSFTLTSSQNYSIGCTTTSLTNVVVSNAQSNSTVTGAPISYTLLPPGYSGGPGYQTSSTNIFTITTPGNYTVVVKDNADFCESHLPISIVQNTFAPDISASASTATLSCGVPSVVLTGYSANSVQGPVTYNWFFQNAGNPNNIIFPTLTVSINPATPSNSIINTYSLQIKEINNQCISNTVVTMYQNTRPPKANIAATQPSLTCSTNSISLTNNSTTGIVAGTFFVSQPVVGLLWEGPTPQLPDSFSSSYYAYTAGVYTLTAEDINNGCTSQTTTTITDARVYPVLMTNTQVALDCNSATTGGVKLAVTAQSLTPTQVTVQWLLPSPTPNVSGANTLTLTTDGVGVYRVIVTTNSNSCTRFELIQVIHGALSALISPDKETGFAPLTVNFTNNSTSSSSVSGTSSITSVWSFGNGTTKTTTTNLSTSAVYTAPGTYTVTMFASKGACRDTVVKVITVDIPSKLVVPNVFTPNGDNNNDLFFVQAANLTQITAEIFDRWGNKIYELTSSTGNISWDGKNQSGHEAPDGTYFYTIKATGKDGQNYDTKGTVSLYR